MTSSVETRVSESAASPLPSLLAQCEAALEDVLRDVNTVRYLIRSIEEVSGAPFPRDRIRCVSLPDGEERRLGGAAAGYVWRRTRAEDARGEILLVSERMTPNPRAAVERSVRHELIHAFDDARGLVEAADCAHQACSEIRAARLSGDCFVGEEMRRGRMDPLRSGMKCVRRRAGMALERNPVCKGFSERAVEGVFRRCYTDYEPFAAPIYALGSYGEERFELKL